MMASNEAPIEKQDIAKGDTEVAKTIQQQTPKIENGADKVQKEVITAVLLLRNKKLDNTVEQQEEQLGKEIEAKSKDNGGLLRLLYS